MQTVDGTALGIGEYTADGFDVSRSDASLDRLLGAGRPLPVRGSGSPVREDF